jgi:hypothetical protein
MVKMSQDDFFFFKMDTADLCDISRLVLSTTALQLHKNNTEFVWVVWFLPIIISFPTHVELELDSVKERKLRIFILDM